MILRFPSKKQNNGMAFNESKNYHKFYSTRDTVRAEHATNT